MTSPYGIHQIKTLPRVELIPRERHAAIRPAGLRRRGVGLVWPTVCHYSAPLADSRALTSFSQNALFFAPYQPQNGANLCAKRAQIAPFKTVTSFVFKYFLASFPLFFIFCSSLHSPIAGTLPLSLAPGAPRRPLRQCVHKITTIVGYHTPRGLSRKKCKKSGRTLPNTVTLLGQPATRGIDLTANIRTSTSPAHELDCHGRLVSTCPITQLSSFV